MSTVGVRVAALRAALPVLREQWGRSGVIRLGTLAVCVLLAGEGLLTLREATQRLRAQTAELAATLSGHQALLRQSGWAARKLESQRQLQALETMTWQASDGALLQAGLIDWVRATALRSGISVREAVASRQVSATGAAAAEASPSQPAPSAVSGGSPLLDRIDLVALQRDGYDMWRVRVNVEFKRAPLLVFLQELYAHPKVAVVERLNLRLAPTGSLAEVEFRVISAPSGTAVQR